MPEAPATAQDKVPGKEHRDAADSTLLYSSAAPDPACPKRACPIIKLSQHRVLLKSTHSAWVMEF